MEEMTGENLTDSLVIVMPSAEYELYISAAGSPRSTWIKGR